LEIQNRAQQRSHYRRR